MNKRLTTILILSLILSLSLTSNISAASNDSNLTEVSTTNTAWTIAKTLTATAARSTIQFDSKNGDTNYRDHRIGYTINSTNASDVVSLYQSRHNYYLTHSFPVSIANNETVRIWFSIVDASEETAYVRNVYLISPAPTATPTPTPTPTATATPSPTVTPTPTATAIPAPIMTLGVDNAVGNINTNVIVPVRIVNVSNGPIQTITFEVLYDTNIISLESIQAGDLTVGWGTIMLGANKNITLNTQYQSKAIPTESSGTVALLNFNVKNMPGASTWINISGIDFANTGNKAQTALAKNGTLTVAEVGTITGKATDSAYGVGIGGAVVNLTSINGNVIIASTTTDAAGMYNFSNISIGNYYVNASKAAFFKNSTSLTVGAAKASVINPVLWLKGDLDNNGIAFQAVDVNMMVQASVGDIIADWRYDLNEDGQAARADDVDLMVKASVGA